MSRYFKIPLCIMSCALLIACSSSDDSPEVKMQEMPIVITLPAEQFTNPHDFETSTGGDATTKASYGATRATPGDPGEYEKFSLPTDLYIFIYVKESASQDVFTYSHIDNIGADKWVKTTYGDDSIYRYNSSIPFDIPAQREEIKVYAAAWNRTLTLKKGTTTISESKDITSEEDIQGVTFDLSSTEEELKKDIENLGNLYSSPYNYKVDNKYYGTMKDPESAQPNIELMLYHVASKLDLMWNVDEDKQDVAKVGEVSAMRLKTKDCFLFKPCENSYSETNDTGSSTYTTDVGTQWLGRKSFYIIPYKNGSDYQVSFNMKSKGSSGTGVTTDITIAPESEIFTPWIRGFITVAGSNF